MKASACRLRLQFFTHKRASFTGKMGPGMTILFYLEKAGFEAEYDHRTLLLEDFYYGKEGLGMASMLNRGLPCISRHLRPAFGTQLSNDDLSS